MGYIYFSISVSTTFCRQKVYFLLHYIHVISFLVNHFADWDYQFILNRNTHFKQTTNIIKNIRSASRIRCETTSHTYCNVSYLGIFVTSYRSNIVILAENSMFSWTLPSTFLPQLNQTLHCNVLFCKALTRDLFSHLGMRMCWLDYGFHDVESAGPLNPKWNNILRCWSTHWQTEAFPPSKGHNWSLHLVTFRHEKWRNSGKDYGFSEIT